MRTKAFPKSRGFLRLDGDALAHNFAFLRQKAGNARVMAVVKANAYGHGVELVAPRLVQAGCDAFAVATPDEALALRTLAPHASVLVLGYTPPARAYELALARISQTVFSIEYARALSREMRRWSIPLPVHLKVDCGMCRLGLAPHDIEGLFGISRLAGLLPRALYTHFPLADTDPDATRHSLALFCGCRKLLAPRGLRLPAHAANSAALLTLPESRLDAVRPGIALYGVSPVATAHSLRPVLSLCAPVVQIREIAAGTPVGYGADFVAPAPMRVGVLPIGYADGFSRALGALPITVRHGSREYATRVLGRICMDQTVIDLTSTPARVGDVAVLFRDVTRPAALLNTIPYEIFTALSARLERSPQ